MPVSPNEHVEIDWIGGNVLVRVGDRSGRYPINDLETWISFYRRQSGLTPKIKAICDAKVALLEQVLKLRDAR